MADRCSLPDRPLVVVIDDAPRVLVVVARTLTEAGYDVLTATDGASGVALIRGHPVLPSLVITDLHMPLMRGEQVAHWLGQHCPQVPIVFMSALGFEGGADLPGFFLPKPFLPSELCATVALVLGHVLS
jgi:DNA-binding response OmpR family regulator